MTPTTEKLIEDTCMAFCMCQTADGIRVPDGYFVECRNKHNFELDKWSAVNTPIFCDALFYRLVPIQQPKRVPLSAADVPPGSHVGETPDKWRVVLMTTDDMVVLPSLLMGDGVTRLPYGELMCNEWWIRRPGEEWVPCWKLEST